jgi:hypothetical protein
MIDASTDNLQLEPWNDGFLLRRTQTNGHVTEIELSENNILTLAQSAQTLRDHILAKHSPAGAEGQPIVATPAPKVRLNFDPLHGEILLSLVEPSGFEHPFALPVNTANSLLEELPRWIAAAIASTSKKSQH